MPWRWPHGVHPVPPAGIARRHDDHDATVLLVVCGVLVDVDVEITIVEGLLPVVVQLEVPDIAFGGVISMTRASPFSRDQ